MSKASQRRKTHHKLQHKAYLQRQQQRIESNRFTSSIAAIGVLSVVVILLILSLFIVA